MFGKNLKLINTRKYISKNKKKYFNILNICSENEFSYKKVYIKKNNTFKIYENNFYLFIDTGNLEINKKIFNVKSFIYCKGNTSIGSINNVTIFLFFFKKINHPKILKASRMNKSNIFMKNYESKKKYWGEIVNLLNSKYGAIKIINMKKDTQSSMEFHINKKENYFIDKGQLDLGIRYARAKNGLIKLKKNNSFLMTPGTIHMRMARQDCKIIEMSTKDSDSDSIIVHDGKNYKFKIGKS
tara:strand:- start:4185 stop:4907 length:723 start_codon:yes stop_codon:yes gene_type:complete